ncbi:MAG: glycosyl hydrolase family 18 protein [Limnochordia bacterium]|nr:glycosyl hydrolase family 18 protein [Limnochordia bacterium]
MKKIFCLSLTLFVGFFVFTAYNIAFAENEETAMITSVAFADDFMVSEARPDSFGNENTAKAFDGNDDTVWLITEKGSEAQLDFDEPRTMNIIHLKEVGSNTRKFRVDAWNGEEWVKVYGNDLIESYHLGVFDTITTNAICLVIEDYVGDAVKIKDVAVAYQGPISRDTEFINMAYFTGCNYVFNWDPVEPKKMDSFTDVTMLGNWQFDKHGNFRIMKERDGTGGFEKTLDPDSEEAKVLLQRWYQWMKSSMGENKPRLWISITAQKDAQRPDGTPEAGAPGGSVDAFSDPAVRAQFIADVVAHLKEYDLDGVDLDWEYPATASQWQDYNNLVIELAEALHLAGKLFSTAQAPNSGLSTQALNSFDRINIMAYDWFGTDQNHSTFAGAVDAIDTFINQRGVAKEKIVLGIPWYADKKGDSTTQTDWKTIYRLLTANNAIGDHTIDPGINTVDIWGFNGPNLVRNKVLYAIQKEIGGVFYWQVKNDFDYDFSYSLARTAKETIDRFVHYEEIMGALSSLAGTVLSDVTPVQIKLPEMTFSHVQILFDEQVLYQGEELPTNLVLNPAALSCGDHTLVLVVIDEHGTLHRDTAKFYVEHFDLIQPKRKGPWAEQIAGEMMIQVEPIIPASCFVDVRVDLKRIVVKLNAMDDSDVSSFEKTLFTGTTLPLNLSVNTLDLEDGAYDLIIHAETSEGIQHQVTERIVIKNWEILEDHILPPEKLGWFGVRDALKAVDKSDGWIYDQTEPELFFGDANRIMPKGGEQQFLTWKMPNLCTYELVLYTENQQIENDVIVQVSSDGDSWTALPYNVSVVYPQNPKSQWLKVHVCGTVPQEQSGVFFRLLFTNQSIPPKALQLGYVRLLGVVDAASLTLFP